MANFRTNNSAATHDIVVNLRTTKTIRHATPRLQYNNNSAATLDMVANLHTKKLSDTPRLPFTETHVVYPQREFENVLFISPLCRILKCSIV